MSDVPAFVSTVVGYTITVKITIVKRACRYQRGNQNPYIEEEQTRQWLKQKRTNNDLQNIHI